MRKKFLNLDLSKNEQIKFLPPRRCIFCGDSKSKLNDEHIIPYALAANSLVFPEATCASCEGTINRDFEAFCLSKSWGTFRQRMQSPTRGRSKSKTHTRVTCRLFDEMNGYTEVAKDLPISSLPLSLPSWIFPPPGIIVGRAPSSQIEGSVWIGCDEHHLEPIIDLFRAETNHEGPLAITIGDLDPRRLSRFLAKTAHAYASAVLGIDNFKPLLLDFILGRDDRYCHFVGGEQVPPEATGSDRVFEFRLGTYAAQDRVFIVV